MTHEQATAELTLPPCEVLREVFERQIVKHPNGETVETIANISAECSAGLYQVVRKYRPTVVIEIGMAYGVSSLSILSGLNDNQHGRLYSIDPYIGWPAGRLIALHQIQRAGHAARHQHLHECSYTGLPRLIDQGIRADLVYIDGNHNFDYAFTDFFLADKLTVENGIIAFNDCGWRSVFNVIGFLKKYRRYRELDVGLPLQFTAQNKLFELVKRCQGRSSLDRYFQKLEDWEPDCNTLRIPGI